MQQHNSESAEQQLRRQQFYLILGEIKRRDSEMAATKEEMKGLYDRAKKFQISKNAINLAKRWSDMSDADIQAEVDDIVFVAQATKRKVGRQLSPLDEDRAPLTEQAYDAGYIVGVEGGDATNPWTAGSEEGNKWQEGVNDGNAFRNAKFAEAIAETESEAATEEFEEEAGND